MCRLQREAGIALPVTIFVITLLTITLAASFARVDADRAVSTGTGDAVTALSLAESGLQSYIGTRTSRPSDGDSVRINLAGGYADVVAHVMTKNADTLQAQLFVVRSTGYVIVPEQGAVHQAVRTIAQFAQWQVGVIRQYAAYAAANNVDDRSPWRIRIDGRDSCVVDSADTWSIRTQNSGQFTHNPGQGTYLGVGVNESGNASNVANETGVDWNSFLIGAFIPDYKTVVTGESLYKSHVIQGNATLNGSGTGLLVVTEDLTTTGTLAQWEGIVLVGDEIVFNADTTRFVGMVMSGLKRLTGSNPSTVRIGEEWLYIRYDSCRIQQTLAGLAGFAPISNAWVDNWATY